MKARAVETNNNQGDFMDRLKTSAEWFQYIGRPNMKQRRLNTILSKRPMKVKSKRSVDDSAALSVRERSPNFFLILY